MNTIKVEVLGAGCKKCQQLEANAKQAIAKLGMEAEVVHITDAIEIAKRGIMSTPALALNNIMIGQGQIISPDQIQEHLQHLMS